jgi:hypothetical protein
LPWDVGDSRFLLWASVAAFVIAALIVSQIFGWFCGWLASRLFEPPGARASVPRNKIAAASSNVAEAAAI